MAQEVQKRPVVVLKTMPEEILAKHLHFAIGKPVDYAKNREKGFRNIDES